MARMASLAGVAFLLGACGGASRSANEPAPAPSLVLVANGAEPRQLLRFAPPLHVPETYELKVKTRINNTFTNTVLETGHRDLDLPTSRFTIRAEATGATPAGEIDLSLETLDAGVLDDVVDPRVKAVTARQVVSLKGKRMSGRAKPSGEGTGFDTSVPPIRWPLFPDAPVGVGAEWRVVSSTTIDRIQWHIAATYRLRELDETRAVLDCAADMKADGQALSVEPNATTTLKSASGHVTATMTVPLHGVVIDGEAHTTTETNLLIVQGHLRVTSTVLTDTLSTMAHLHM